MHYLSLAQSFGDPVCGIFSLIQTLIVDLSVKSYCLIASSLFLTDFMGLW